MQLYKHIYKPPEQHHGFTCANPLGLERSRLVIELQEPSKLSSVKIISLNETACKGSSIMATNLILLAHHVMVKIDSSCPANQMKEEHHKNEDCKKYI
jgi:hypothetical protein